MIPVNPFPLPRSSNSFVSGTAAADHRTRVEYFRDPASDHLHATVRFGPQTEGPPQAVHGGAIAAVLDEAMGAVCWMNGHAVVAARLTVNFRHLTPIGFVGHVESWIDHTERRKIFLKSRLTDADGKVHAEGDALFIELQPEMKERMDDARRRANETV